VDLNAIRSNIEKICSVINDGTMVCAVIKADAYGHGAVAVAGCVQDMVDYFAVATMDEAMELRRAGIRKPILILGFVHPHFCLSAADNDIRLTVFSYNYARKISDIVSTAGLKVKIHIKLDTGMSRIGFACTDESLEDILKISRLPGIETEGMFTHFARADEESPAYALKQLDAFNAFYERMKKEGVTVPVRHCSNSAAATYLRESDLDMIRLGISAYGMYPSGFISQIKLTPALSLKSHVIMVKKISKGTHVGYGGTWTAVKDSYIATIPVGYADGYHRTLSNRGAVLINGCRYPVVGRICMDQLMADVTPENPDKPCMVNEGDEAVLIGKSGENRITAEELAELAGTINYELTCSLSPRVPRCYD